MLRPLRCWTGCSQALTAIQKDFGAKIAENLYNGGKEFTFNTFELRGAAGYLQKGLTIKEISETIHVPEESIELMAQYYERKMK